MDKLVLRNSRLDSGTWFATASVFAIAGLLSLGGLVVMNVRDPKALWMGPSVKYPQAIYLVFDGLTLAWAVAMTGLAIFKGKKFFDRSIQLTVDAEGIHDHRGEGQEIAWHEVAELTDWVLYSGAIATAAQLKVLTKDGSTVGVDILGLDQDHKAILKAVKKIAKEAARGRKPGKTTK
jgi:hypothetical protein